MSKLALITGASKGIGKALATVFAQNNYNLILIARTTSELEELSAALKAQYNVTAKIISVDLSHPEAVDTIIAACKEDLPHLDVLVNNAGFGIIDKFTDTPAVDIDGMIAVNIAALTKLMYRVLPYMVAKKSGKVMNIASVAGYSPGPYMAVYYATKSYVLYLSQSLYDEYKPDGITITAVCPGVTRTSFQVRAHMENSRMMSGAMPIMTAEEVANIAYKAMEKGKRVVVAGWMNKLSVMSILLMPNFLIAKMTMMIMKPKK